jgi:hypothetical protein
MLVISGCATSPSAAGVADGTPEPTASTPSAGAAGEAAAVSGVGPTGFPGVEFPIPADARSVVIDFVCDGGDSFSVELGDSMMLGQAPLGGTCDGGGAPAWPVTEQTGSTLSVRVGEDVAWVATSEFSPEEFATDAATAADCAAAGHIAAISQACDVNQTPLHIQAEFGG